MNIYVDAENKDAYKIVNVYIVENNIICYTKHLFSERKVQQFMYTAIKIKIQFILLILHS
jgi:hypothetical protein